MTPLPSPARDIAERLSDRAFEVCRTYLPNGRRCGAYWIVGDVRNARGRSLYVRLTGPRSGRGAAGRWTDAATGEHGDLLDLVQAALGLTSLRQALDEARRFLALPAPVGSRPRAPADWVGAARRPAPDMARRLFYSGRPIPGTPAATYLQGRSLVAVDEAALRYHPACYYRPPGDGPTETWPALLAAITDAEGTIQAVHRTWLDRDGKAKAPVPDPRRSLGHQLGNGVRFSGLSKHLLMVGEGLETVLSVRAALPRMPAVAGLSANHLAALSLPPGITRLYIARDADEDGRRAAEALCERAGQAGIPDVRVLDPVHDDFNTDLSRLGLLGLARHLAGQIAPEDERWLSCVAREPATRLA